MNTQTIVFEEKLIDTTSPMKERSLISKMTSPDNPYSLKDNQELVQITICFSLIMIVMGTVIFAVYGIPWIGLFTSRMIHNQSTLNCSSTDQVYRNQVCCHQSDPACFFHGMLVVFLFIAFVTSIKVIIFVYRACWQAYTYALTM